MGLFLRTIWRKHQLPEFEVLLRVSDKRLSLSDNSKSLSSLASLASSSASRSEVTFLGATRCLFLKLGGLLRFILRAGRDRGVASWPSPSSEELELEVMWSSVSGNSKEVTEVAAADGVFGGTVRSVFTQVEVIWGCLMTSLIAEDASVISSLIRALWCGVKGTCNFKKVKLGNQ